MSQQAPLINSDIPCPVEGGDFHTPLTRLTTTSMMCHQPYQPIILIKACSLWDSDEADSACGSVGSVCLGSAAPAALAVAIAALAGRAAELPPNGAVNAAADAEEGDANDDATDASDHGNCWIGPMTT